jgi:hypothetical protein
MRPLIMMLVIILDRRERKIITINQESLTQLKVLIDHPWITWLSFFPRKESVIVFLKKLAEPHFVMFHLAWNFQGMVGPCIHCVYTLNNQEGFSGPSRVCVQWVDSEKWLLILDSRAPKYRLEVMRLVQVVDNRSQKMNMKK